MRQYLIILWRNLRRERLYAVINIAGLSLGLACCLVLGQFLRKEFSYDRYHPQHERIFRVVNEFTNNGSAERSATTSRSLGPMLQEQYPEVKAFVRLQHNGNTLGKGTPIRYGEQVYNWADTYWVSPNVFDLFHHDVIYGDPKTALQDTNTVAVSQRFARTYFGDENPVGKIVTTEAGTKQKITLVFADQPANTHLKYDMLFSENVGWLKGPDDATQRRRNLWGGGLYTYLLMDPQFKVSDWPRINDEFYQRNMAENGLKFSTSWHSWLQPLADIHLHSDVTRDMPTRNPLYLYGCAAVGVFILLVACINYMNLATARATRRARSVAIRKVLGASRLSLALQFLAESIAFSGVALLLGVALVVLALSVTPLSSLMDGEVTLDFLRDPQVLGGLLSLALLMGLLSGAYPAIYLSHWAPLTALTGRYAAGKGSLRVREALVILQFTVSAAVIAATLLMTAQMRYVAGKDLGFQKENRVTVTLRGVPTLEKVPQIRAELEKDGNILGIAQVSSMLGEQVGYMNVPIEGEDGVLSRTLVDAMPISREFVRVMGLQLVNGRDFSQQLLTNKGSPATATEAVVNEAMVRKMGWTDAVGKRFNLGDDTTGFVIGVVKDFNFQSLHNAVEPLLMWPLWMDYSNMDQIDRPFLIQKLVFNISGKDVEKTIGHIERVVREADPRHPFEYEFLDERLDQLYKDEHKLTALIGVFAGLCIFIACLGLFGLAAFATEQRTREIGTRKVLGASALQIILLLSKRMLLLVVVASLIASVLAYFAVQTWLVSFAYRDSINYFIFVLAAAAVAAVAFFTIALQSYKTASADPVHSLRQA
jgi:putative ABC transport system permease protein